MRIEKEEKQDNVTEIQPKADYFLAKILLYSKEHSNPFDFVNKWEDLTNELGPILAGLKENEKDYFYEHLNKQIQKYNINSTILPYVSPSISLYKEQLLNALGYFHTLDQKLKSYIFLGQGELTKLTIDDLDQDLKSNKINKSAFELILKLHYGDKGETLDHFLVDVMKVSKSKLSSSKVIDKYISIMDHLQKNKDYYSTDPLRSKADEDNIKSILYGTIPLHPPNTQQVGPSQINLFDTISTAALIYKYKTTDFKPHIENLNILTNLLTTYSTGGSLPPYSQALLLSKNYSTLFDSMLHLDQQNRGNVLNSLLFYYSHLYSNLPLENRYIALGNFLDKVLSTNFYQHDTLDQAVSSAGSFTDRGRIRTHSQQTILGFPSVGGNFQSDTYNILRFFSPNLNPFNLQESSANLDMFITSFIPGFYPIKPYYPSSIYQKPKFDAIQLISAIDHIRRLVAEYYKPKIVLSFNEISAHTFASHSKFPTNEFSRGSGSIDVHGLEHQIRASGTVESQEYRGGKESKAANVALNATLSANQLFLQYVKDKKIDLSQVTDENLLANLNLALREGTDMLFFFEMPQHSTSTSEKEEIIGSLYIYDYGSRTWYRANINELDEDINKLNEDLSEFRHYFFSLRQALLGEDTPVQFAVERQNSKVNQTSNVNKTTVEAERWGFMIGVALSNDTGASLFRSTEGNMSISFVRSTNLVVTSVGLFHIKEEPTPGVYYNPIDSTQSQKGSQTFANFGSTTKNNEFTALFGVTNNSGANKPMVGGRFSHLDKSVAWSAAALYSFNPVYGTYILETSGGVDYGSLNLLAYVKAAMDNVTKKGAGDPNARQLEINLNIGESKLVGVGVSLPNAHTSIESSDILKSLHNLYIRLMSTIKENKGEDVETILIQVADLVKLYAETTLASVLSDPNNKTNTYIKFSTGEGGISGIFNYNPHQNQWMATLSIPLPDNRQIQLLYLNDAKIHTTNQSATKRDAFGAKYQEGPWTIAAIYPDRPTLFSPFSIAVAYGKDKWKFGVEFFNPTPSVGNNKKISGIITYGNVQNNFSLIVSNQDYERLNSWVLSLQRIWDFYNHIRLTAFSSDIERPPDGIRGSSNIYVPYVYDLNINRDGGKAWGFELGAGGVFPGLGVFSRGEWGLTARLLQGYGGSTWEIRLNLSLPF
ncbi:MAG: hypothetical protein QXW70_03030 [Candidatus Anstonellales archaeon]